VHPAPPNASSTQGIEDRLHAQALLTARAPVQRPHGSRPRHCAACPQRPRWSWWAPGPSPIAQWTLGHADLGRGGDRLHVLDELKQQIEIVHSVTLQPSAAEPASCAQMHGARHRLAVETLLSASYAPLLRALKPVPRSPGWREHDERSERWFAGEQQAEPGEHRARRTRSRRTP
jgi:hypothetical protein